jgi:hypothetical protein
MGLDIANIVMASWIVIIVIIVFLPPPPKECRLEMCKGERESGGNCFDANTVPVPLPRCGRAGRVSKSFFSWSSLLLASLKTLFFCKLGQSYKKRKIKGCQCMYNYEIPALTITNQLIDVPVQLCSD